MAKDIKKEEPVDEILEHRPVVPYNEEIEQKKKELRKKAEKLRENLIVKEPIVITEAGEAKKASELTLAEQKQEYIKCALDPVYFIETYLTIFDQTRGEEGEIVPFVLFEIQKRLIKEYMTHKFNVANKYRQAGISTTTCAYIAWYLIFNENKSVAIVADKLETARDELMRDVVDFINGCPTYLRIEPTGKNTQKHKVYDNECEVRAFASTSLRGYTPTLLFWDETAWAEKGEKFWTAARPSLQTGGRAIFVSTPNGLDPVFYLNFEGAREKKNNFNAIELWWYNDPRYNSYTEKLCGYIPGKKEGELDLEWVKNKGKQNEVRVKDEDWSLDKRQQMVDDGWEATSSWFEGQIRDYNGDDKKLAQELLCSFLGSGDNFISEEYITRMEELEKMVPIRQEYIDNEMWIFEDVIPDETYIQALDVSSGHGEDFSTINILRIEEVIEEKVFLKNGVEQKKKIRRHNLVQVAEYYNKITPQNLGYMAVEYGRRYNNAYTVIDVSNGYGAITIEKMIEDGYENIHYSEMSHKPTRDRLSGYIKTEIKDNPDNTTRKVDLIPGFFIGNNRGSVLIEMQRCINMGEVIIRSHRLIREFKTFVNVSGNRVADHKRSFHDDSIMSLAIGLYTVNRELFKLGDSITKVKKMIDAMLSVNSGEMPESVKKEIKTTNEDTRTPDYRVSRENPYGANSWLFQGMKKR